MNRWQLDWKFWGAMFTALIIFAFAASTPLWVPKVSDNRVLAVDPQTIVGLVALVVGVLALGSGAAYLLLKGQVEDTVRRDIEQDYLTPIHMSLHSLTSFTFYLEYSGKWSEWRSVDSTNKDPQFQWAVLQAVEFAESALKLARNLPSTARNRRWQLERIVSLAYHLATQYFCQANDGARRKALSLVGEINREFLQNYELRSYEFEETVAWVQMLCYENASQFDEGWEIVRRLLGDQEIPFLWRQLQHDKYTRIVRTILPKPRM